MNKVDIANVKKFKKKDKILENCECALTILFGMSLFLFACAGSANSPVALWLLIPTVLFFISSLAIHIYCEYVEFNHGICPVCGKRLELADTDSQGGRLWSCPNMKHDHYSCWISYGLVDHK